MTLISPETDQDKQDFRDEYSNAVTTLTAIRDANPLPDAQVKPAIQYLAKILLFIIRMIARRWG